MHDQPTHNQAFAADDPRGMHIAGDVIGRQLQDIAILTRETALHLSNAMGINQTDLALMEQLITHGPLSPNELAARLAVTTAGVTLVIDRLERAGHVTRVRQQDDKRRVLVHPVPASVAQTYTHIAPMLNGLDAVLSGLSAGERTTIEHFLQQVITVYQTTLPTTAEKKIK
ncbi:MULTISPECIES: MarR family winged helix-turn-helix transcriptional regulator [Janthinobacterium]|uniref:MarR family transcriptional regulator n=1 Tax=Janthinobacterium kumbetense TaxID=2950280 RepID=A0ABT0WPL0_9BURK|nr:MULTISPECIES: MarR family transcriptional regulator [Janthinobacterium]MCM2564841.1 MarR family transcriptional regulator [Janthinobacterium kumbetense]MDN2700833.1 MarR family transcriptional regulator [Janthinobacterium sp. SUN100]MDN2714124.1 MarR family transcriptional regulator [Janthinobacterium sp. SUN120]MDO8047406.1 MarR family transcriptional regulator [Janthinobacterium sp. SUN211]MDO8064923.1 MarR family transcriptional regulator [Janthinobacterium sp. SUN206]